MVAHICRFLGDNWNYIGHDCSDLAIIMIVRAFSAIAILAASSLAQADQAVVSGTPRVIDGDTLEVNGERVRLQGIDIRPKGVRSAGMPRLPNTAADRQPRKL